jgi:hypothetical protein
LWCRLTWSTGKLKVVHGIESDLGSLDILELNISRSFTLAVLLISSEFTSQKMKPT